MLWIVWIVMISDMRYIWVHPKWRCGSPMNILESLLRGVKDIPCRWLLRPLPLPWATERDDRTDSDGRNALQALSFALVLSRKKSSAWQWRRAANSASSIVGGEIAWYYWSSLKLQIQFLIPCCFKLFNHSTTLITGYKLQIVVQNKRGHMDVGCSCSNEVWMSPST